MYCDFLACAGDEVFNQMAKWQAMSADIIKMPVVLRVSVGSKYGAQHLSLIHIFHQQAGERHDRNVHGPHTAGQDGL